MNGEESNRPGGNIKTADETRNIMGRPPVQLNWLALLIFLGAAVVVVWMVLLVQLKETIKGNVTVISKNDSIYFYAGIEKTDVLRMKPGQQVRIVPAKRNNQQLKELATTVQGIMPGGDTATHYTVFALKPIQGKWGTGTEPVYAYCVVETGKKNLFKKFFN